MVEGSRYRRAHGASASKCHRGVLSHVAMARQVQRRQEAQRVTQARSARLPRTPWPSAVAVTRPQSRRHVSWFERSARVVPNASERFVAYACLSSSSTTLATRGDGHLRIPHPTLRDPSTTIRCRRWRGRGGHQRSGGLGALLCTVTNRVVRRNHSDLTVLTRARILALIHSPFGTPSKSTACKSRMIPRPRTRALRLVRRARHSGVGFVRKDNETWWQP
jgi:hypothetical protein